MLTKEVRYFFSFKNPAKKTVKITMYKMDSKKSETPKTNGMK